MTNTFLCGNAFSFGVCRNVARVVIALYLEICADVDDEDKLKGGRGDHLLLRRPRLEKTRRKRCSLACIIGGSTEGKGLCDCERKREDDCVCVRARVREGGGYRCVCVCAHRVSELRGVRSAAVNAK